MAAASLLRVLALVFVLVGVFWTESSYADNGSTLPGSDSDPGTTADPGRGPGFVGDGNGHGAGPPEEDSHQKNDTHTGSGEHDEVDRFPVAVFDFARVATPFVVSIWVVFASAAKIVFHLNNKLSSIFPESCLLILVGILLGIVLYFSDVQGYNMNNHTFFFYLLPPIVLDAGYFMPNRAFFDNIGTILLYAVVGTLLNTLLVGFSLWGLSQTTGVGLIPFPLEMLHCLVFAALLAAVDPVAVLAVFEEIHVNEMLHIVVFGESLLNDGVTVVLYHMFEKFAHITQASILAVDVVSGVASFLVVAVCSPLIGALYAFLCALMTRFSGHVPVIQPLIVLVMGYLSYLTAEMFHLSGILACTFCGIAMKKYVEANISRKSHTTVKYFLKMLASVCETIIFMLLGISTVVDTHYWDTAFILLTLFFCLFYRAVCVIILTFFANRVRLIKLSKVDQFIMAYGGLRGAIAFSLAVLLSKDLIPQRELFITSTVVVVYFTNFVLGSTIKPLVNVLKVKKASKHKPSMNESIHTRLVDHMMAGIEDITGHFGHHELLERYQKIDNRYLKRVLMRPSARVTKTAGHSILQVWQKLNEQDMETWARHNSTLIPRMHLDPSFVLPKSASFSQLLALFSSSHAFPTSDSSVPGALLSQPSVGTCLDLQAMDAPDTRKMRDDGRTHHFFEEAMFKPRKRFTRHRRHMLPPEGENHPPFHHKARLHLRHLMSPRHKHGDNGSKNLPGNGQGHTNGLEVNNGSRPKKNVSFAQVTEIAKDDADSGSMQVQSGGEETVTDDDDDDDPQGITFTVHMENEQPADGATVEPTAVESSLPWKRNTGRDPLPSSVTHSMPDDHHPLLGEAPSWVNNDDYTSPGALPAEQTKADGGEPEPKANLVGFDNPALEPTVDMGDGHVTSPSVTVDIEPSHVTSCETEGDGNNRTGGSCQNGHCSAEDPEGLPLPWRVASCDEVAVLARNGMHPAEYPATPEEVGELSPMMYFAPAPQPATQQHSGKHKAMVKTSGIPPPPWRDSKWPAEVNRDASAPKPQTPVRAYGGYCGSSSSPASEPHLPPLPWRQHGEPNPVLKSPSASFDLEGISLRPQHSCHSFRLSEAESRHSEPVHHHHMIEHPLHGRPLLECEVGGDRTLDLETEQMDPHERITTWLMSSEPGPLEEHQEDEELVTIVPATSVPPSTPPLDSAKSDPVEFLLGDDKESKL